MNQKPDTPRVVVGPPLVVVGASGHGLVVAEAAESAGYSVVGFLDDGLPAGVTALGARVLGGSAVLPELVRAHPLLGVAIAIGDNAVRRRCMQKIQTLCPGVWFPPVRHAAARIAPDAVIGEGAVVLAGAVVCVGARVGDFALVNTRASLDHHSVLGAFASLAPAAATGGDVRIGDGAAIGMGACVLQGRAVGADAVVGAMALVYDDVPPGMVVHGIPARARGARDFSKSYLSHPRRETR